MADMTNRLTSGFPRFYFRPALAIAIPFVVILGWTFVHPLYSIQTPVPSTMRVPGPAAEPFFAWLIREDDAGITDKIRNAKRISLSEPSAFKRIAKVHQILSAFHSGLSVADEERLSELIYQESLRYGYDPELIVSVIVTESSFYKWARSRKGAIGMMQLTPVTGQELAEINRTPLRNAKALYDPHLNIKLGIQYLALLHQRFGDLGLALAAYNYGPTRVAGLMGRGEYLPSGYTQKILRRYKQLLREDPIIALPPSTDSLF